MATDAAPGGERDDEVRLQISLTRAQALAAGAVLRGYLAHQRERLGDGAAANPNFRNVQGALDAIDAIEERTGDQKGTQRGTA
jgi:hypothetical protein